MSSLSRPQSISVIIPARDEANSISTLIPKIKRDLSGYPYQLIIVDDGSKDGTSEIIKSNGAISILQDKSMGKGAAMKIGVENAKEDIIVFLDADGAHDPKDIPSMIAPIIEGKADLVIGSRCMLESKDLVKPLTRRISNNFASIAISVVISYVLPAATFFNHMVRRPRQAKMSQLFHLKWLRIRDCTSGFRAIKKESWRKLDLVSQGFQIETEMIFEAARNNLVIVEVPISYNWNGSRSHLHIIKDGLRTLRLLVRKLVRISSSQTK